MYHLRSSDRRLIENFKDKIPFFEPIDQTILSVEKAAVLLNTGPIKWRKETFGLRFQQQITKAE